MAQLGDLDVITIPKAHLFQSFKSTVIESRNDQFAGKSFLMKDYLDRTITGKSAVTHTFEW